MLLSVARNCLKTQNGVESKHSVKFAFFLVVHLLKYPSPLPAGSSCANLSQVCPNQFILHLCYLFCFDSHVPTAWCSISEVEKSSVENPILFLTYGWKWTQSSSWAAKIHNFCFVTGTNKHALGSQPELWARVLIFGWFSWFEYLVVRVWRVYAAFPFGYKLICCNCHYIKSTGVFSRWAFRSSICVFPLPPFSPCSVLLNLWKYFSHCGDPGTPAELWQFHISPTLAVVSAEIQVSHLGQMSIFYTLWQ